MIGEDESPGGFLCRQIGFAVEEEAKVMIDELNSDCSSVRSVSGSFFLEQTLSG